MQTHHFCVRKALLSNNGTRFHISVSQKCAEYVPWIVDLVGGRKNTKTFLGLYGTTLFLKNCHKNVGLVVTALL